MKILTANRLTDGEVVWLAKDGSWAESIEPSEIVADKEGEARLEAIGKSAVEQREVVDINLIDIDLVDGKIVPLRLRERIRAAGPTNRTDLGKQASRQGAN
ncbi:MAG: DUF2849 domain-containing protein [Rhizobiaceae bacterium]|nr:DUF2849 domain-containing protein [Rhizobiaceae bacterium]